MKSILKKHVINLAIAVVFILILTGAGLSFYNNQVMERSLVLKQQSELVLREMENTFLNIRNMDISSRGYAIIPEDRFLFLTVENAHKTNQRNFQRLDSLLNIQGFSDFENYEKVKEGFTHYASLYGEMVSHLKQGNFEEYRKLLSEDYGKQFWTINEKFSNQLTAYEAELNSLAQEQYEAAVFRNWLVQILLMVIGLPTLLVVVFTLRKESVKREKLLLNLQENNQKYLFNDGSEVSRDSKEILDNSIRNLEKASDFVNQISDGNYEVRWEELNEHNAPLNQNNLAGRLILMRDQMKKVKEEDKKRLWSTGGLSEFSEIIRNSQEGMAELSDKALTYLVKYLNAQQGSLFIVEGNENEKPFLRLAACYAFHRKKFLDKRVEIGEGLIGQAYLEAESIFLTDLPQGYTTITSGLGDATPNSVIIVPMKFNEKVQAILELASFNVLEPHQLQFLEKAGEFMASAIATTQNNEKTKILLEQLQAQTEQMRAQEEELRQNMEELEATQEEMSRKEKELEVQLLELKNQTT